MNSLLDKLDKMYRVLEKAGNNEIMLNDAQLEKLEDEIERIEHELKHPVHVEATLEEDITD